ncbi:MULTISPECIES: FUSC family protein [Burkholderia]|uniref:Fusaric acid resistance protein n=1 Tax=Burkholderia paludis TaxID=1506587 RepID=A0A6J5F572_9BURK|nr:MULTISPECIES: FUSC family protein [Burkholderia]CAB3773503.1 hypothetical protein LMG30113_07185 [Burkholderia paludis]VWC28681.1 fusaric acid resistance protein [Burkholderia paludis]
MNDSLIFSYLTPSRDAVKAAIRISVSVWGAMIIAFLMNFEHPVWAMITGLISFFAPDQGQVVKKCLYQCISTIVGGVAGLLLASLTAQSPFFAAIGLAFLVAIASALSYHSRDANYTFCFAIFSVTVAIVVMVPVFIGTSSETIAEVFIDRVGTVLAGVVWVSLVSTALWPKFNLESLKKASGNLAVSALKIGCLFTGDERVFKDQIHALFGSLIACEDLASHCTMEGVRGKRTAKGAREVNRMVVDVVAIAYALRRAYSAATPAGRQFVSTEIAGLARQTESAAADPARLGSFLRDRIDALKAESATRNGPDGAGFGQIMSEDLINLFGLLGKIFERHGKLEQDVKDAPVGIVVRRHLQIRNTLVNGFRSFLYCLAAFGVWYSTGWVYGFLIVVVPTVLSIVLGKAPHQEVLLKKIAIGVGVGIVAGLPVYVLLAGAPSAVELLVVTAAPALFIGLLGLSRLDSFAYSLGYALSYLIVVLPMNSHEVTLNVSFAVERSLCVGVGTILLAILFVILPRTPFLGRDTRSEQAFQGEMKRAFRSRPDPSHLADWHREIALIVDKAVSICAEVDAARKTDVLRAAGRCISVVWQVARVESWLEKRVDAGQSASLLKPWKVEILDTFVKGRHSIVKPLSNRLAEASAPECRRLAMDRFVVEHDYLIGQVLEERSQEQK